MKKPKIEMIAYAQASRQPQRQEINSGRNGIITTKTTTWTRTRGEMLGRYQTMMRMLHVTLNGAAGGVKGLDGLGIRDSSLRSE